MVYYEPKSILVMALLLGGSCTRKVDSRLGTWQEASRLCGGVNGWGSVASPYSIGVGTKFPSSECLDRVGDDFGILFDSFEADSAWVGIVDRYSMLDGVGPGGLPTSEFDAPLTLLLSSLRLLLAQDLGTFDVADRNPLVSRSLVDAGKGLGHDGESQLAAVLYDLLVTDVAAIRLETLSEQDEYSDFAARWDRPTRTIVVSRTIQGAPPDVLSLLLHEMRHKSVSHDRLDRGYSTDIGPEKAWGWSISTIALLHEGVTEKDETLEWCFAHSMREHLLRVELAIDGDGDLLPPWNDGGDFPWRETLPWPR